MAIVHIAVVLAEPVVVKAQCVGEAHVARHLLVDLRRGTLLWGFDMVE
jgi:hypothetical protein